MKRLIVVIFMLMISLIGFLIMIYNVKKEVNDVSFNGDMYYQIAFLKNKNWYMRAEFLVDQGILISIDSRLYFEINDVLINIPMVEANNYVCVTCVQGGFGYGYVVRKNHVQMEAKKEPFNGKFIRRNDQITMVWDLIDDFSANQELRFKKYKNINVVSPTWFYFNEEGVVINNADYNYVKEANERGVEVWGLFDNRFDDDLTFAVLQSKERKEKIIEQTIILAEYYGLSGINIDFEGLREKTGDLVYSFVEELATELKKNEIVVSIDMPMPTDYNLHYHQEKIAKIADYYILMAYDQHWIGSKQAGPIAPLKWVEAGLVRTLNYVPKEKLILGIPLYNYRWVIDKKTDEVVDVGVLAIDEVLREFRDDELIYDEKTEYYFFEKSGVDTNVRVWLENQEMVEKRLLLAEKNGLIGVAAWRVGMGKAVVWELLQYGKN